MSGVDDVVRYRDECDTLREQSRRSMPTPEHDRVAERFGHALAEARGRINSLTDALEAKNVGHGSGGWG